MALWTRLVHSVRPEQLLAYEERLRRLAAQAQQRKDRLQWGGYQTAFGELGNFYYVSQAQSWSEIAERGTPQELVQRVLGEKEGQKWLEELSRCLLAAAQTVSIDRADLSYMPDGEPSLASFAVVTVSRVRPDGVEAFEEFVRKIAEAIPKAGDPARIQTRQTLVGDLREYAVIRPVERISDLDRQLQAADLLTKAFGGAEGGLLFRTGFAAIESVERRIVARRDDLSNRSERS
jgi:hypothetical protein